MSASSLMPTATMRVGRPGSRAASSWVISSGRVIEPGSSLAPSVISTTLLE